MILASPILPPFIAQTSTIQQQQPVAVKKPSPSIDRIVNIYSINSVKRVQKKRFFLGGAQPPPLQASPNDDIRVKLRQLREGIGYFEAKATAAASRNQ
jgi:hypothetical protein